MAVGATSVRKSDCVGLESVSGQATTRPADQISKHQGEHACAHALATQGG
jgi:hypothetical protein